MHSLYSPSSAFRWVNCPASVHLTDLDRKYLKQRDTTAADRGTLGHKIVERRLRDEDTSDLEEYADQELLDAVDYCLDWVGRNLENAKSETRIVSSFIQDFGGTIDQLDPQKDVLHIADFKFGKQPVSARDNEQLLCYLVLAWEKYPDYQRFIGTIIQPHLDYVESVEYTDDDLDEFFQRVLDATLSNDYNPGSWCTHCPILWRCETAAREVFEAKEDVPENPTEDDILKVTRAFKAYKLANQALNYIGPILRSWIEDGTIAPASFGIRASTSNRRNWRPGPDIQGMVEQQLGPAAYTKQLVTPAKAEKILGVDRDELEDIFPNCIETTPTLRLYINNSDSDF